MSDTYRVAEQVRDLLAKHIAESGFEENVNYALRIAWALWVKSSEVSRSSLVGAQPE